MPTEERGMRMLLNYTGHYEVRNSCNRSVSIFLGADATETVRAPVIFQTTCPPMPGASLLIV